MTNRRTRLYLCWVSVVLTIVFALPSCGQDNTAPSAPVVSDPADMLPIEIEDLKVHSRILGQDVAYSIILPYDYYSSSKNYPVVYMLHGIGGDLIHRQPEQAARRPPPLFAGGALWPLWHGAG